MKRILILILLLSSCSATKKAQRQVNKVLNNSLAFNRLGMYWQALNPCVNDTATKTVTKFVTGNPVVKHDTLWRNGIPYLIRDSIAVHDTIYLDKDHYITDGRQVRQLTDSISQAKRDYADLYSAMIRDRAQYKQDMQNEQDKTKAEKKKTSKANWRFVWACIIGGVLILRKPLLSFATGGWSKLLGIFK